MATGEVLVYVDDDVEVTTGWLSAIATAFTEPAVGVAVGRVLPEYECHPPQWVEGLWVPVGQGRVLSQYSLIDLGLEDRQVTPEYAYGCNFAIRRALLTQVGGFHPDGMPAALSRYRGDGELAVVEAVWRRGWAVVYKADAALRHVVSSERMTQAYLRNRSYLQGISNSYSDIRKAGGANTTALRLVIRRARALAGATARSVSAWFPLANRSLLSIKRAMLLALTEGYFYHQREAKRDPALLSWILRDDYWDEKSSPIL